MPAPGQTGWVDARSALFDLYGDHLRPRGGRAPVAALVRMLSPLGITAPAVRTAVSRMARQGWLEAVRLPEGAGYALTPRAVRRLDQAAERIYRHGEPDWDGRWHLLVAERVRERARRDRLRAGLEYLGYAPIGETTWVSPRSSIELEALLEAERVRAERFVASYDGDARGLVARAWDLDGLARAYQRWLAMAARLVAPVGSDDAGRGGLRRAKCPGTRVAQVPVPGSGAARRAAACGVAGTGRGGSVRRRIGAALACRRPFRGLLSAGGQPGSARPDQLRRYPWPTACSAISMAR